MVPVFIFNVMCADACPAETKYNCSFGYFSKDGLTYHLNYLSYERMWGYDSSGICSTPFIKFLVVQLSLEDNVDFQYLHDM